MSSLLLSRIPIHPTQTMFLFLFSVWLYPGSPLPSLAVFGLVSVWVVCKHVGQVEMPGFWVLGVSSLIDLSIRAPRTEHSGRCQIGCISVPVSGFESPGATIFGFGFILSEYSSHSTSFYSTSLPPSTSPHTSPSQQHLAGGVGGACPHSVDSKELAGNNPMLCRCPRRHL